MPDASRITPPRIDALHPDAAYFFIEGWLAAADAASGSVSSPTHAVRVREVGETIMIELAEGDAVPDRDFVLVWNEPKEKQIVFQGWHWKETEEIYALVQIRAPEKVNVASDFSQDFYFLVDRSGSMQGVKWTRTCEALHAFVKLLGKQDRVWITLFESDFQDFAEAPIPAPDVLADAGFQRMKALGVAGGTNLLPAAEHLIKQIARHSVRRRTSVVLITDGQVGNEEQIIRAFRQTPKVTIHTFGIDTAVNDSFLKSLARQYRGRCWLQTPDDDMVGTIATLGDQLRRPVITELTVNSPWFAAADTLPDLYAKEIVTLAVRGVQTAPVEIRGRYPDGSEYRAQIELKGGSEAVKLLWAKEHIAALLPDHREAAILEAKKHNLLCEGAAFIAWDETEQVDVAQEEMVQPSLDNLERSRVIMQSGGWAKAKEFQDIIPDSMPRGVKTLRKLRASPPSHQIERSTWLGQFIDAFAGWLGGKRSKPLEQRLKDPVDLIVEIRSGVLSKALSDALEPRIGQVMAGSRDALLEWTKRCRPAFQELCRIREMLVARKLPQELVDRLLTWTVQAGEIDDARLHQLRETLLAISNRPPFSAQAEIRLWQSFLMKDSHLERVTE
ncbi:MAG: VWA domain-containing protein [Verrucomicrobiota bacterium]